MTDTQRIKKDLPSLREIGQAEEVARRLQEAVQRLNGEDYVTVTFELGRDTEGHPEPKWTIYTPEHRHCDGRNPLDIVDSMFPDTETAIARKRESLNGEIEVLRRQLASKEAEYEQLQRLEVETKG